MLGEFYLNFDVLYFNLPSPQCTSLNSYYYLSLISHTQKYLNLNNNNRLDGKSLPLPPHQNGTQWGQATAARNVERYCASNNPCTNAFCPEPFECVDLWNKYECR